MEEVIYETGKTGEGFIEPLYIKLNLLRVLRFSLKSFAKGTSGRLRQTQKETIDSFIIINIYLLNIYTNKTIKQKMMKKTYSLLMSGAMLLSLGLTSCTSENTTGVNTETNATEAEDINSGAMEGDTDVGMSSESGTGSDTTSTTTPPTDNDM